MKRTVIRLLILFALSFGSSRRLMAQQLSLDSFLETVSAHPVGDEAERNQYFKVAETLLGATPTEIARVLPSVLQHMRNANEIHVRVYAVGFLLDIAMRPDGADLLQANSQDISALIVDIDPVIQRVAVSVTEYVMGRYGANKQTYVLALMAGIHKPQTLQDVAVMMAGLLLQIAPGDAAAVQSALDFLHRDDLTTTTRMSVLHDIAPLPDLPRDVAQTLVKCLDDPDPSVRAAAVIAFAQSNSTFHDLVKDRIVRMEKDPQEHPQVRELAKKALAGETSLNPNIDVGTQAQSVDLETSIAHVKSEGFSQTDIETIVRDGSALQVIPALEQRFACETDDAKKDMLANALVKLKDKDDVYWNFLLQQATLAVDSDLPDPIHDLHGNPMEHDLSPALKAWALSHHVDASNAAQSALYELPGKVLLLGETGDRRGIPLLRRSLQSRNPMIVIMGAKGLAQIQDKDSIPLIIEACRRVPKGYDGAIAESSLVFFDDPRAQSAVDAYVPKERAEFWRDARKSGLKPFGY